MSQIRENPSLKTLPSRQSRPEFVAMLTRSGSRILQKHSFSCSTFVASGHIPQMLYLRGDIYSILLRFRQKLLHSGESLCCICVARYRACAKLT